VSGDHALIGFFTELITRLQRIGTVTAIDYGEYTNDLNWTQAGDS
jgi:hypothetical protein